MAQPAATCAVVRGARSDRRAPREVSVLFADLEGFTAFSEHSSAQEVARMLNRYLVAVVPPIVRRHGGEVDRIMGDALMVVFNLRGDQPDHAARAVRAAVALQRGTEGDPAPSGACP